MLHREQLDDAAWTAVIGGPSALLRYAKLDCRSKLLGALGAGVLVTPIGAGGLAAGTTSIADNSVLTTGKFSKCLRDAG